MSASKRSEHFRGSTLLLACLLLVPATSGRAPSRLPRTTQTTLETRQDLWPNGQKRSEWTVRTNADGKEVRHGPCQAWWANGALRIEGKFEDDREKGRWKYFHENRQKSAEGSFSNGLRTGWWETYYPDGQRASKGRYGEGVRSGNWRFWKEDGTEDLLHSGEYAGLVQERSAHSDHAYRGELLDGQRHGEWVSTWPDGRTQLIASYSRGTREGPWRFHHQDGSRSSLILSGLYSEGRWVGPLPADFAEPDVESFGRPAPARSLTRFESPPEDPLCSSAMTALLEASEAEISVARQEIDRERTHPGWTDPEWIPRIIARLRRLDPEQPEDRRAIGRLDAVALSALCHGHTFSAHAPASAPDAAMAREVVLAWSSLWALRGVERWFWRLDLRFASPPPTLAEGREWLCEPQPLAIPSHELPDLFRVADGRALLRATLGAAGERALTDALDWLRAHQEPDGSWSGQGFAARCGRIGTDVCGGPGQAHDVGLTALALLAFLGGGDTLEEGEHHEVVMRAVEWLLEHQDPGSGMILKRGDKAPNTYFIHEQAYATRALCEALATCPSRALRERATRAVELLLRARNPYGAWRYAIEPDGSSDTVVTGEVVVALASAAAVGLELDLKSAFEGAASWIDEVSDPASGRVGYDGFGKLPSRLPTNQHFPPEKGEAPTALGLFSRILMGQRPEDDPILHKNAQLLLSKPPVWDPEGLGCDMYYWLYGTLALWQMGQPYWPRWEMALKSAVVDSQRQDGDAKGSWDPEGPWGSIGGRIYATAMMAQSLEAGLRYSRLPGAR